MSSPIVFLDSETSGLHPDRRAWEVAMIRREVDGTEHEHLLQVLDVDLSGADLYALKVGGFHDRHVLYGGQRPAGPLVPQLLAPGEVEPMVEADVARRVEEVTRGAVLVGSNVAFDAELLGAMLRRHHLAPAWQYRTVDLATLAAGWLLTRDGNLQGEAPWRSEALAAACGVEPASQEERHTAMGDVLWVRRWWDVLDGLER